MTTHRSSALDELDGHATVTVTEAAATLGISRTLAYEAARRGELPTRRLGHCLVVPVPWLLNWLHGD
jgi:excisionase family DNA binding protein